MDPKDNSSHESRRGGYRLSHVWDDMLAKTTEAQRKNVPSQNE